MADIPQEVREAVRKYFALEGFLSPCLPDTIGELFEFASAMFLAGKRAGMRLEQVSGTTLDEMRANLSSHLRNSGDCVLCWVNEGDLAEQVIAQAIRSENDG